ncbi:WW domain binding protein VOPP1 isoform X1 [Agelaius tricolor]|uniref:WW domain binding protein VOPP1 isoform X1 n=1 Tax=Agelaius tricolor TaxID=9191 RepID=UPI0039F1E840
MSLPMGSAPQAVRGQECWGAAGPGWVRPGAGAGAVLTGVRGGRARRGSGVSLLEHRRIIRGVMEQSNTGPVPRDTNCCELPIPSRLTDCPGDAKPCTEAKKHCWYFEGLYPTYYICRSYEDCCGSRCCVRALSIQRLWYFWFLLMMGVLFCCGAGFFIRRRMYPPPLVEEPTFNVSYTRQPVNNASGSQQPGVPYYTDPGGPVMNPMAMAFHVQPNSPQGNPVYPPPPSYCNTPPPPYEQVVKSST